MGSVAKSYLKKGFLIYEEMRQYLAIYEEAVSHIRLCNCSTLNFPIYEENLIFLFYQCIEHSLSSTNTACTLRNTSCGDCSQVGTSLHSTVSSHR